MELNKDLNNGFYKNLDENFETACKLADKDFEHLELINMLQSGNIPEKQIAALKLDCVASKEDANVLISNLTWCDGKIREAVALKIYQILTENKLNFEYFTPYFKNMADASIDINGNICRLIADSVIYLKQNKDFTEGYTKCILQYTKEALDELDKFIFRDKKYVINKQLFKLYWCLEALSNFYEFVEINKMKNILERCSNVDEYTIREKVAKIAVLSDDFLEFREKLKNDENYYVREAVGKTI